MKQAALAGMQEGWRHAHVTARRYLIWIAKDKQELRGLNKRLETAKRRAANAPTPTPSTLTPGGEP